MKFKTSVKVFSGKLNPVPLIDICFLLIIFFIISTSYDFQPGFKVSLPQADAQTLIAADKLVIVITSYQDDKGETKYELLFNNQSYDWEDFEEELAITIKDRTFNKLSSSARKPVLALKADKSTPYEYITRVSNLATRLNIELNLVMAQKTNNL